MNQINQNENNKVFEQISNKECEIKSLKQKLSINKKILWSVRKDTFFGELINIFIYIEELMILKFFGHSLTFHWFFTIMVPFYIIFKAGNVFVCGTRIGRHRKRKQLVTNISNIKSQINILTDELNITKNNYNYLKSPIISECIESKTQKQNTFASDKPKVKKLTLKK